MAECTSSPSGQKIPRIDLAELGTRTFFPRQHVTRNWRGTCSVGSISPPLVLLLERGQLPPATLNSSIYDAVTRQNFRLPSFAIWSHLATVHCRTVQGSFFEIYNFASGVAFPLRGSLPSQGWPSLSTYSKIFLHFSQ